MKTILEKESLYDKELDNEYVVELLKRNETLKLSILSDTMFKAMFQNESRKKYSCKLFSLLFNIDYNYLFDNLTLVKNESNKMQESDKSERCDYVASINGSMINLEVNNNSNIETMERNIEYAYRIYSGKVKVDTDYTYTNACQICLNNFAFKGNDKTIDVYYIQNEEGLLLTKKLTFILIYVPNIIKKCYTKGIESLNELEKYILTMVEQDKEKALEYGKGDSLMKEYVNESIDVSRYSYLGEAYDKEWALKDEAYRNGISKGIEQGENKERFEIAKRLLKENLDINFISKITGLSINELKNYINL